MIRLFYILFFCAFCELAICQKIDYNEIIFNHFGYEQGFKSGQALSIDKDKDGYLWIGTENGLLRYDGHTFKRFASDESIPHGLTSNYISNIVIDKYNRIWINSGNTLRLYDINQKKFIPLNWNGNQNRPFRFYKVAKDDKVWFVTLHGLFYNSGPGLDIKELVIPDMNSKAITTMAIDKMGVLWLGGLFGLVSYDPLTNKIITKTVEFGTGILCSYLDEDQILWLGLWTEGFIRFDTRLKTSKRYAWEDIKIIQNGLLNIAPNHFDNDNSLWLNTTEGLMLFDKKNESFTSYKSENNLKNKVAGSGFGFHYDSIGILWIGNNRGLHKLDLKNQLVEIKHLNLDYYKHNGIGSILFLKKEKTDSICFFLMEYGPFLKYDLVKNRIVPFPSHLRHYFNTEAVIYDVEMDSNQQIYIVGQKYGLMIYDPFSQKITKIPKENIDVNLISISIDRATNTVYFGSKKGIYVFDNKNKIVKPIEDVNAEVERSGGAVYVTAPVVDGYGNLWCFSKKYEHESLICKYKATNKIVKYSTLDDKIMRKLKVITDLLLIDKENLILGSYNGFCQIKAGKTESFFHLFDTYNNEKISTVSNLTCLSNTVWGANEFGIFWFSTKDKTLVNLTNNNSKLGPMVSPGLFPSPNSNLIYISQRNSLNIINPKLIKPFGRDSIHLCEMKVNGKEWAFKEGNEIKLELDHTQNQLEFQFTIHNFTNPTHFIYNFKKDRSEIWQGMQSNRLMFDDISGGSHTYYVNGYNSFGKKTINTLKIIVNKRPIFYKTWWFSAILFALFGYLIFLIFKYRETQRQKLEKLRFNIARDLHDDMGSTLSQIKMMSEREALKSNNNQYANISTMLSDVMHNMSEIVWSINPNYDTLEEVILKIQEFAINTLEPQNIDLKFSIGLYESKRKLNPEEKRHLYLLFKEAINNVLKYANARHVTLQVYSEDEKVTIKLKDDGIGFDLLLIHHGNGLKNMKSRAEALKAKLSISTTDGVEILLSF